MKTPSKKYLKSLSAALEEKTSGTIPLDVAHKWASRYISSEYHKDKPEHVADMAADSFCTSGGAMDKRADVIDEFLRDTDDNYSKAKDCEHPPFSWSYHINLEAYWSSCLRFDWNEIQADDGRLFYFWNK